MPPNPRKLACHRISLHIERYSYRRRELACSRQTCPNQKKAPERAGVAFLLSISYTETDSLILHASWGIPSKCECVVLLTKCECVDPLALRLFCHCYKAVSAYTLQALASFNIKAFLPWAPLCAVKQDRIGRIGGN
jgi:hypothetical protein